MTEDDLRALIQNEIKMAIHEALEITVVALDSVAAGIARVAPAEFLAGFEEATDTVRAFRDRADVSA